MIETVTPLRRHESWTKGGPVVSNLDDVEITALEDRAVATMADPSVLGLWGFATGTWIVGVVLSGSFPQSALVGTVPVLLVFAGLAQFIAGLFAFRRSNMLTATAFCSFGAFNVTAAAYFGFQALKFIPMTGSSTVLMGFLLESFAFIAFALAMAAMQKNMTLILVLSTLGVGYCLSGIPDLANAIGAPGWAIIQGIGGWFLVASAFFAFYMGMALVVNSSWGRTVIPIGGEP